MTPGIDNCHGTTCCFNGFFSGFGALMGFDLNGFMDFAASEHFDFVVFSQNAFFV